MTDVREGWNCQATIWSRRPEECVGGDDHQSCGPATWVPDAAPVRSQQENT